jgi:bifunctional UDP-N-acetylglucosamine pyrophosphorylase / glucosamine-1-phosphate N-acetyltransferase
MNICAVIPAAGQGTRLGLQIPKILLPIRDELNVWSILRDKLITNVNHIAVVLAPSAVPAFESVLDRESVSARAAVSVVVQERPTGMGDAIFLAWPVWRHFESILVGVRHWSPSWLSTNINMGGLPGKDNCDVWTNDG